MLFSYSCNNILNENFSPKCSWLVMFGHLYFCISSEVLFPRHVWCIIHTCCHTMMDVSWDSVSTYTSYGTNKNNILQATYVTWLIHKSVCNKHWSCFKSTFAISNSATALIYISSNHKPFKGEPHVLEDSNIREWAHWPWVIHPSSHISPNLKPSTCLANGQRSISQDQYTSRSLSLMPESLVEKEPC